MLNALCVKPIDYKSIALPAELQGHPMLSQIFIAKAQINQCIKRSALMLLQHYLRYLSFLHPYSYQS